MDTHCHQLGELTWPDLAPGQTLLVPLGSTEQHGPHLPFDTDTRIASAVCEAVAQRLASVVVAPALAYGASGEHAGFPGTLSIGTDVLHSVLVELARSAQSAFDRIVFVNGHGGNMAAVQRAVTQLQHEGHSVLAWAPRIQNGDAHAGRTETSLLLAICPSEVKVERAEPGVDLPLDQIFDQLVREGVAGVSPNGVLGDPSGASAAEGERLLDELVDDLCTATVV